MHGLRLLYLLLDCVQSCKDHLRIELDLVDLLRPFMGRSRYNAHSKNNHEVVQRIERHQLRQVRQQCTNTLLDEFGEDCLRCDGVARGKNLVEIGKLGQEVVFDVVVGRLVRDCVVRHCIYSLNF